MAKVKSNTVVSRDWSEDGNVLTFQVKGVEKPIMFDRRLVSAGCRDRAEQHGWEQRLGDRAAKSQDTKTGKPAQPQEKWEAIQVLAQHYQAGSEAWRMVGERKPVDTEALLNALCALNPGLSKVALAAMVEAAKAQMEKE